MQKARARHGQEPNAQHPNDGPPHLQPRWTMLRRQARRGLGAGSGPRIVNMSGHNVNANHGPDTWCEMGTSLKV